MRSRPVVARQGRRELLMVLLHVCASARSCPLSCRVPRPGCAACMCADARHAWPVADGRC
eukprot:3429198-Prymnesium_polylepis.1